jgi:uncharacterized SAM-binding protein YcdF (DUF218 family)
MTAVRSGNGEGAGGGPRAEASARPRLLSRILRKLGRAAVMIAVLAAIAIPAGFLWFAMRLPAEEAPPARNADGIVVLTGGSSRISDAIELLAA